ncbi:MAG TPA: hypothetical protein VGN95_25260 [Pyrinomonadaceae bacterium]|jgi:hypothetical protein|nr:hypothetical protein [Pyrinomonadaceae bacterium]
MKDELEINAPPLLEVTRLPSGIFYLDENGIISRYDSVHDAVLPKSVLRQNFFKMLADCSVSKVNYSDLLESGIAQTVETVDGVRVTFLRINESLCVVLCSPLPTEHQTTVELNLLGPTFCIVNGRLIVSYEKGGAR